VLSGLASQAQPLHSPIQLALEARSVVCLEVQPMLRLVRKLNSRLSRTKLSAEMVSAQLPAALPRKPGADKQHWTQQEAHLLLQCESAHTLVKANMADLRQCQTLILGVDLLSNQLLLDSLLPAPPLPQLIDGQPFWLTLPLATGEYRICVQPREVLPDRTLLVDIVTTRRIDQRIDSQHVSFAPNTGPRVRLQAKSGKSLSGRLSRLSSTKAWVTSYENLLGERWKAGTVVDCVLTFNERFEIHSTARLTRLVPVREGRPQQQLIIEFTQMPEADEAKLQAFIQALSQHKQVAA
jgi:hypothetical protein